MPETFPLCYITDRRALQPKPLLPLVQEAVRAAVDLVQIREKDLATRDLLSLVGAAVAEARQAKSGTRVIVNERLDVALAAGAHGAHLGTQSMPAPVVRKIVPKGFLIGVSCHSLREALEAESAGADYALLGPIFETPSKIRYGPPLGLETLRDVAARVSIPLYALGGITVERVRPCLEAGATGIAGIAVFQTAESLAERVRELRSQRL
jgi:thiamine-phosphate pyrophosphorylase